MRSTYNNRYISIFFYFIYDFNNKFIRIAESSYSYNVRIENMNSIIKFNSTIFYCIVKNFYIYIILF